MMGELMRCYWIPAALSSELARDGAPVRLMLLGEKLIAFRDSAGRVGVMDHRCPHRCASLFLGRNEEGGIRCIYHGWKFDVAGNCLDMPSLPPPGFKEKVKAKAYKVVERAGVVWVYMGSRAEAPPLPGFEILDVPEDEIKRQLHPARLQLAAGARGRDRHLAFRLPARRPRRSRRSLRGRAGLHTPSSTARRSIIWPRRPGARSMPATARRSPGKTYWRFGNFLFPFWTQAPNGEFGSHMHARAWVPLDDEHTMFCYLWWKRGTSAMSLPQPAFKDGTPIGGTGRGSKILPNTTDWLGRWRMAANASNDWGIDRAAQQNNTIYSGIDGIHLQDQAITESMGADRRPRMRASGAFRPDDHAHAPAPVDGGARACATRACCRPASRIRRSIAPAAATSSATTTAPGRRSMPGSWPPRCIRSERLARGRIAAVSHQEATRRRGEAAKGPRGPWLC